MTNSLKPAGGLDPASRYLPSLEASVPESNYCCSQARGVGWNRAGLGHLRKEASALHRVGGPLSLSLRAVPQGPA